MHPAGMIARKPGADFAAPGPLGAGCRRQQGAQPNRPASTSDFRNSEAKLCGYRPVAVHNGSRVSAVACSGPP